MALEPCPECGTEISEKADECPHCGVDIDRTTAWQRGCVSLGCAPWVIVILAAIGGMFGSVPGAIVGGVLGVLFLIGYTIQGDGNAVSPSNEEGDNSQSEGGDDAAYYQQAIQHHAQTCQRHMRRARDESLPWKNRMQALQVANEAQEKCSEAFVEAVENQATDKLGDLEKPNHDFFKLENELFEPRKGDPALEWEYLPARLKCKHARELERCGHKDIAEDVYWSLVDEGFEGSRPYERLAIMYRNQDQDKEVEVLEIGMEQMRLSTGKKRQKFEDRLDRARELQRSNE